MKTIKVKYFRNILKQLRLNISYREQHQLVVRTGFEPATYGFQIRRSNHSATLPPVKVPSVSTFFTFSYTIRPSLISGQISIYFEAQSVFCFRKSHINENGGKQNTISKLYFNRFSQSLF